VKRTLVGLGYISIFMFDYFANASFQLEVREKNSQGLKKL